MVLYRYFVKPSLSLYTKVSGQALVYENGQKSCMDAGANATYRFSQCLEHRNQVFPLQVYLPTVERHMDLSYMSEMFLLSSLINVFWQIWHVRSDGKLVSDATRLCAVVDGVKSMDNTTGRM